MKLVIVSIFIFLQFRNALSDVDILEDENLKLLPKIYEIGRPESCIKGKEQFCHLTIKLYPKNAENPSKFWKTIEQTQASKDFFDHSILKYAVCVNTHDSHNNVINLNESLSSFYTEKFKHLGLVANLIKIDCDLLDRRLYQPKLVDWIFLCSILAYIMLTIFATLCDFRKIVVQERVLAFSVIRNYRKLVNNDGGKMKCVQGVRFFATISVLFCHTYASLIFGYVGKTEYFEEIPKIWWKHAIRSYFSFIVQTFFVISGWFLSYGTLKLMKNQQNKESPWKFVFLTFLNRCLRLFPVLALTIFIMGTTWAPGLIKGPIRKYLIDGEFLRCREIWWINFLFVNNIVPFETCCLPTWYLATDTQLYLLSLIILVIIWKFELNFVKTFLKLIFGAILLQMFLIYKHNVSNLIYELNPGNMVQVMETTFSAVFVLYLSPISRTASYFIGILFGYLYFRIEDRKIILKITKIQEFFWVFSSLALPLLSVLISNYKFDKMTTTVLAALVKPVYALGISLGILGMMTNSGGTTAALRVICEWKPIVFLANMNYSVYLIQTIHIFNKAVTNPEFFQISDWGLVKHFIEDGVIVYFLAFWTHLLVELPMGELQNLVVPRIKAKSSRKD